MIFLDDLGTQLDALCGAIEAKGYGEAKVDVTLSHRRPRPFAVSLSAVNRVLLTTRQIYGLGNSFEQAMTSAQAQVSGLADFGDARKAA